MLRTGQYGLSVRVPVYTPLGCIRRNMSHNAYAEYRTESVYVVEERKTCSYGMTRHGTRIVAAYICDLSSSPTEDYEDLESKYRKVEGGASRMRCVHLVHACTWYVRISY